MENFDEVKEMIYKVMCDSFDIPSKALASAFIYLKKNPEVSIKEALLVGVEDNEFFENN